MFVQILLLPTFRAMKFLSVLLFSIASFCFGKRAIACGSEYFYTPAQMPLLHGKLDLEKLLTAAHYPESPYWWVGFGKNVVATKDSLFKVLAGKANVYPESIEAKYQQIIDVLLKKDEFKLLSDYAWYELRVGNKQRALLLLEQLYTLHPNEYNIVINLGTAYEVNGNNAKALELVRKAVDLNGSAHHKSEWIHIKILEQKLSIPADYKKIINLGITDFAKWIINDQYVFPQAPDSLKVQLAFQLHQRISFTNPPDSIVAQLVLDFADIVAKHDGSVSAIPFYDYAAKYADRSSNETIAERKKILSATKTEIEGTFRRAAIVWAIPLIALVIIFIAWLRSLRK